MLFLQSSPLWHHSAVMPDAVSARSGYMLQKQDSNCTSEVSHCTGPNQRDLCGMIDSSAD